MFNLFDLCLKILAFGVLLYWLFSYFIFDYQFSYATEYKDCGYVLSVGTNMIGDRVKTQQELVLILNKQGKIYNFVYNYAKQDSKLLFLREVKPNQKVCFTYFIPFSKFFYGEYVLKSIHVE